MCRRAVSSPNVHGQCACSPRAVVGPAELSAGHAVVQGQRPRTGHKNGFSVRMVKFWREISLDLEFNVNVPQFDLWVILSYWKEKKQMFMNRC